MTQQPETPTTKSYLRALVRYISSERLGTGPLAELRRMDPDGSLAEPAFHRIVAQAEVPEHWLGPDRIRTWGLVVHAYALLGPDLLKSNKPLGQAIYEADVKERRLLQFLNAPESQANAALTRVLRLMRSHGVGADPIEIGFYILNLADSEQRERARQRVAARYYRAKAADEKAAA